MYHLKVVTANVDFVHFNIVDFTFVMFFFFFQVLFEVVFTFAQYCTLHHIDIHIFFYIEIKIGRKSLSLELDVMNMV